MAGIGMDTERQAFGASRLRWDDHDHGLAARLGDWRARGAAAMLSPSGPGTSESSDIQSTADFPAVFDLATLDGTNGFRLEGRRPNDDAGLAVSSADDFNGDGFDDFLVGAPMANSAGRDGVGESYLVFGKAGGFDASLDLGALKTGGIRFGGVGPSDRAGQSVSSAGDFNGDGFDDIIIGAYNADTGGGSSSGASYVVFGRAGPFPRQFDLAALDGDTGFRLDGLDGSDFSGTSVSSAGDVNGDGFDDIVIGARWADPDGRKFAGESYVVFGKADGFAASFDLATLDGDSGFRIDGAEASDLSGISVASAGDVNNDNFADLIIGAYRATPDGKREAGSTYVVFGKADGFAASLDLASIDGTNGVRFDGIDPFDYSGTSVSSAGDINGDGFDDIIIGADQGGSGGENEAGESYIVFGRADAFAASVDLKRLDGTNGFRIAGIDGFDYSGTSVSGAGDFNGDGFDDVIIGAWLGDPNGDTSAGESYVVFGKAGGFDAILDLAALDGANGFRLDGIDPGDFAGYSVSDAGDVNADGFDDIIIGAPGADPDGNPGAGEAYLIFGRASAKAVVTIGSAAERAMLGGDAAHAAILPSLDRAFGEDADATLWAILGMGGTPHDMHVPIAIA